MKFYLMKKKIIIVFALLLIALAILNYRIPFFHEIGGAWSIGYNFSEKFPDNIKIEKNKIFSVEDLKRISDSTQFLADPFFIKEKDSFYLFFEHKKIKKHPAEIGLLTSKDGKKYTYKGTVLKQNFHLSYPQVFKYKNNFYMLPETQGGNNVILYKASNFPYEWKIEDTLIANIKLKDPTIFLSDTLNIIAATDSNTNLFIYTSKSLNDKWELHKKSIAMIGTEARPGGRFIKDSKGLILPIQNSKLGYGSGLSLYRFQFKNNTYSIEKIKHLFLSKNKSFKEFNYGMHHIDIQKVNNKYYYVYDGNRLENNDKKFNIKRSLKANYYDLKNWTFQTILK